MEVKEAEKIVIAKPVASRPTSSSFRSFSELLANAINASPSNACSEIAVTAIRPKTLRFKPVVDHISAEVLSSQIEISEAAVCFPYDMVLKSDNKSSVVYKPIAKLAPRTTVSVLANLGSSNSIYQQEVAEMGAHVQQPKGVTSVPKLASELYQNPQFQSERKKPMECSKLTSESLEEDHKSLMQTNTADRLSYDGYNWRKYGQKQVKGSEYPRSYYKCTHPNCPVRKKVERSLDGKIAEIVYKGEHNHSKPQPLKRGSSDTRGLGFVCDATGSETNNPPWKNQLSEKNEGAEGKVENENEVGSSGHSTHSSSTPSFYDPMTAGALYAGVNAVDHSCGLSEECDEVSKDSKAGGDGPKGQRRRNGNHLDGVETSKESTKEPHTIVQNPSDSEILGDGFHWRKYGQKVVKGNQYPRSYYRCTSLKCNVRKYVERTSDDPGTFITTYEGRHNHDMPIKKHNHAFSQPDRRKTQKLDLTILQCNNIKSCWKHKDEGPEVWCTAGQISHPTTPQVLCERFHNDKFCMFN